MRRHRDDRQHRFDRDVIGFVPSNAALGASGRQAVFHERELWSLAIANGLQQYTTRNFQAFARMSSGNRAPTR